ncbi:MAG: hypothetical protein J5695_03850 [Bacteroidales bacterium]|nr:hypothetical protein [Bacteroidales bacterium]
MKKTLIIAALAAAAFAVSCQNEVVVDAPQDGIAHDYRTVTLQLPVPDTKINISETDGKVKWVAGDQIIVHGKLVSEMQTITLTASDISADGLSAQITFDASIEPYGDHDFYAQYPASAVHPSSSSNAYHYCEFNDTNKPLMGAYLDKEANAFIFCNLCAVLSFKVSGDYDSYEFVGNNEEVVGYKQYGIKRHVTDTYVRTPGEALNSISGPVVADGSTPNLICLAPTYSAESSSKTVFSEGFSIRLKKNGVIVKEAKTVKEQTVKRNQYVLLGDITGILTDYVPEAHHSSITGATDLGASETANCYVITAPGSYKIPVVKGNSNESAGTRAKTKLLWETYNNDQDVVKNSVIAAVDYDDDDNYVYFKTPGSLQPGNALIAAVDEDENIIWSWHIWIPSSPIQTIGDYKVSTKYLMDRNLGALTGEAGENGMNYGMLYQWGRKDPRVGLDGNGGTSYAKTAPAGAISAVNIENRSKTVLDAIQNPTVFYNNCHVWYDSANEEEELWAPTKTIYDPCPAGWVVPEKNAISTGPSVEDATNGGVTVGSVYFPGTGGASRYTGTWKEGNTFLWSCTTYPGSDNSKERANWFLFKDAESAGFDVKEYKTTAVPVRCVKIDGEVPAPDLAGATSVVLDGSFGDWADADTITESGDIKEWKFGSDASNIYFYFKIPLTSIKAGKEETYEDGLGYPFRDRRYIYLAINTDNDEATGSAASAGGLSITGCEAQALVFPFRGYASTAEGLGTEGLEFVNGVDENGWIENPVDTKNEGKITAFGSADGTYAYLEIGVPRDKIGSPANGKMKIQFSFSWNLTSEKVFIVK